MAGKESSEAARCASDYCKIHVKTRPVAESLFEAGLGDGDQS